MPIPPFAQGRPWRRRANHAGRALRDRVWYDPTTGYEYAPDPNAGKPTWHEINWRHGLYREIDPVTGQPVHGSVGRWRKLK
jgi:hypothetical protein